MSQNAVYISISWYSKICWFLVKKCWCQQNSRVCHVIHIFLGSSLGITVPSFILVGYVCQIFGRRGLFAPPPTPPLSVSAPKRLILNRVKTRQDTQTEKLQSSKKNLGFSFKCLMIILITPNWPAQS